MNPYFISLGFIVRGLGEHKNYSAMDGLADAIAVEENPETLHPLVQKSVDIFLRALEVRP